MATCPKCPENAALIFTEAGRLAGHLVEDHSVSASVALADARRLIGRADVEPRTQIRTAPAVAPPAITPPEEPMPKRKTITCSKCHKPGHNARGCHQTADEKKAAAEISGPKPARKHVKTRGVNKAGIARGGLIRISAAPTPASLDLAEHAKERASGLVRQKLAEELVWAQAYVDELKRVSSLA